LLNRFIPEMASHCISLDNDQGGYLATKALLELGHEDLAYVSGPYWKMDSFKRLTGHKRALAEFGLEYNEQLTYEGNFEEASGRAAIKHFKQLGIPYTAIVCANDEMAAGVMYGARELGLKIPEDLSVIGFDNVSFSHFLHPKLSSIDCRIDEMGQMAARCVLKYIYGQATLEIENKFEPNLILRESIKSRQAK
jgi:LacI family transcriptional regulator